MRGGILAQLYLCARCRAKGCSLWIFVIYPFTIRLQGSQCHWLLVKTTIWKYLVSYCLCVASYKGNWLGSPHFTLGLRPSLTWAPNSSKAKLNFIWEQCSPYMYRTWYWHKIKDGSLQSFIILGYHLVEILGTFQGVEILQSHNTFPACCRTTRQAVASHWGVGCLAYCA